MFLLCSYCFLGLPYYPTVGFPIHSELSGAWEAGRSFRNLFWLAVKELNLSYQKKEALLFGAHRCVYICIYMCMYPYCGNLHEVPNSNLLFVL